MISAGDFRNGVTIEFEGNIYQIIEFQHVKPGKGAAFVRTKSYCPYREKRYAVPVQRRRSVYFHGYGNL